LVVVVVVGGGWWVVGGWCLFLPIIILPSIERSA
jgi:hypothetical protein